MVFRNLKDNMEVQMYKKLLVVSLFVTAIFCWLNAEQKVINLSYNAGDFEFITTSEGTQIKYNGNQNVVFSNEPGAPNLPTQLVMVAIPDGAEFQNLSFSYNAEIVLSNVEIAPAQNIMPTSMQVGDTAIADPDPQYYAVGEYPENSCIYSSTQILRTYRVFCFQVSPFVYLPSTNQLKLITSGSLIINYSLTDFRNDSMWDDGSAGEALKRIVVNPNDVIVQNNRDIVDPNDVKYLIITDGSYVDEFTPLADWKTQKGIPTAIVTTQYIYSHYPGADYKLQIKNCIKDYYLDKGTSYVLLGGGQQIIPVALCYGLQGMYVRDNIPTDLFYSCLDGQLDWNFDADNHIGEINDGWNGSYLDVTPEVSIGRVSVNQTTQVSAFVTKTLNYEKYTGYPTNQFADKMLLAGYELYADITYQGITRSDSDWFSRQMYQDVDPPLESEEYFFDTSPLQVDGETYFSNSQEDNKQVISKGWNIINWSMHGGANTWGYTAQGNDQYFFTSNCVDQLTNQNKVGLIYTTACHSNDFTDPAGCLGAKFVNADSIGAIAYIGASSFNWTNSAPSTPSDFGAAFDYAEKFYVSLFDNINSNQGIIGDAFKDSKLSMAGFHPTLTGEYRWTHFSLNLLGDPELRIWTDTPTAYDVELPQYFTSDNQFQNYNLVINTGVANSLVCASNGSELYEYCYTNAAGVAILNIDTIETNDITITITGRNKLPFVGQIPYHVLNVRGTIALSTNPEDVSLTCVRLKDATSGSIVVDTYPDPDGNFAFGVGAGLYFIEYELFQPNLHKFYYPVISSQINIQGSTTVIELPLVTLTKYNMNDLRISTSTTLPYFKTIGQALLRVQSAVNTSYNGEAIVIKILPSVYYESLDLSPLANGQISSLTLKGWGEGAVINAQNTNSCIRIVGNGIGNIVIENLTISNGWSGIQVNLQNCDRLTVVDCEITSCASSVHSGVGIGSNVPTTVSCCTITENHGYDSGQGDDTIGGGLYIFNNTDSPTIVSDCSISNNSANVASAIYMGGSGHFNIRRNRICYNSQGQDTQRYYIAGTVGSAVIENNLFMDGNYSNCIKVQNSGSTTDVVSIQNNTFDWFEACISINSDSSVNIDNNVFKQSTIGISSDSSNNDIQVRNNAFNTTIPFDGITYDPLVHTGCVFTEELNLDNNYIPIWNLEVKSICIDNGNPDTNGDGETWLTDHNDRDSDGTQKDIGAIPLIDGHLHRYHNLTNDKVRYISIPGVVNYPNSLYYVFHEFRDNGLFRIDDPVLEQITWMYNTDNAYASPSVIPEHFVCSQNGYKVTLTENAPDMLIQYQGYYPGNPMNQGMFIQDLDRYTIEHFITPPEPGADGCQLDNNTNVWFREIYLGYYLQESLKPFDALLPILDNITTIMAEDWAMARIPIYGYNPSPGDEPADAYTNTWLGCFPTGGREITINPGEMVVVRYIGNEPVEFPLGGDNPDPPFTDPYYREMATHFGYEEQPDYIPVFLSIDLNQFEDGNKPTEIAVFVDDECKGAAVIKEGEVQLNAYITNITDPTEELKNLEFRMYFPGKATNANVLDYSVLNNQSGRFESRNVTVSECKEFLQVRIGATEELPLPTMTQLFSNYPNPFNPETTISFDLAEQSPVTIEVFNIKGQKMKTLVRDSYTPGHHSVVWNGTDNNGNSVSSGVYFYRMNTPNHISTQKMLLLK